MTKEEILEDGCTTLMVTGDKAEGPNEDYTWGIMIKNSDTSLGSRERPVHVAAGARSFEYQNGPLEANHTTFNGNNFAYTCGYAAPSGLSGLPVELTNAVFGQNERGLTVSYGAVYGLPMSVDDTAYTMTNVLSLGGRELTTAFLAFYDDVDDIITDLLDSTTIIGKYNRRGAQVVSVLDNTGKGVVFEISVNKVVYETVTNDFFATGNVSRMWNLNAQGEATVFEDYDDSGTRSQYMVNIYTALANANKGRLNYKDAVKYAARYCQYKEESEDNFNNNISGWWEICNDGTYASMVGVTGDTRYYGKLNAFFASYGNSPIVACYLLHIAEAGVIPVDGAGAWSDGYPNNQMYNHVEQVKKVAAQAGGEWVPADVRTIQEYAFIVEDYQFEQWEYMLESIAGGLGDAAIVTLLNALVDASQVTGAAAYRAGAVPKLVTYTSDPVSKAGVEALHMPYSTPINDDMVIPVVDGETITLAVPAQTDIDVTDTCALTIEIVGPSVGAQACSVTLNPPGGTYAPDTDVTLTPVAGSFYRFHSWDGALSGTANPHVITMTSDETVICNFEYIVGPDAGKEAYFDGLGEVGYTPEAANLGVQVTAAFPSDGGGLDGSELADVTKNPFYTPYFFHGDALDDFPMIRLSGDDVTLQNCIVDDGGSFPLDPVPGNAAVGITGDGCSIINCTLTNCVRYGFTTQGGDDFYIGYNTVTDAQYCISGSGGMSANGLVEFNNLRGMTRNAFKIRGWDDVLVRNNWADLTPTDIINPASTVGFWFSTNFPYVVDVTCEHNVMIQIATGSGRESHGYGSQAVVPVNGINTRNIVQNNVFINVHRPGYLSGNTNPNTGAPDIDYTIDGNTFINATHTSVEANDFGDNNDALDVNNTFI